MSTVRLKDASSKGGEINFKYLGLLLTITNLLSSWVELSWHVIRQFGDDDKNCFRLWPPIQLLLAHYILNLSYISLKLLSYFLPQCELVGYYAIQNKSSSNLVAAILDFDQANTKWARWPVADISPFEIFEVRGQWVIGRTLVGCQYILTLMSYIPLRWTVARKDYKLIYRQCYNVV